MIKSIDRTSVQRICSGQVVVDLTSAVKELIENALDSKASVVEIRLHDMGATCIEVSDNGSGICPADYHGIALKHHTSKLESFNDIYSVQTFGFRGEAINALCELSESLIITTKANGQSTGTVLKFDQFGSLLSQSVIARANGTTVQVNNLFERLPVRRKDFVKTIKKQFQKMIRVVQSYALISVGTKVSVSNVNSDGPKSTVFSTQCSVRLMDNVCTLFGSKFASSLIPIDLAVRVEYGNAIHVVEDDNLVQGDTTASCDMALISPAPSTERSIRISGLVSKVGIGVGRCDNDRQFMFCNSRPVDLSRFAKALNEVWRRYEMKQKPAFVLNVLVPSGMFDINMTPDKREVLIVQEQLVIEKLKAFVDVLYAPVRNTMQLNQGINGAGGGLFAAKRTSDDSAVDRVSITPDDSPEMDEKDNSDFADEHFKLGDLRPLSNSRETSEMSYSRDVRTLTSSVQDTGSIKKICGQSMLRQRVSPQKVVEQKTARDSDDSSTVIWKLKCDQVLARFKQKRCAAREYRSSLKKRTYADINRDANGIHSRCAYKCDDKDESFDVSLEAKAHPQADRLQPRVLSKKMFPLMHIIGQFNLGFIIAYLDGDLYILDQHACDEKYRFESLQRTTQIHQQPLIHPLTVETSPALEVIITENLELFSFNGFKLRVDAEQSTGKRIQLLSVPFSKSIHFGVDDVNELASMISDSGDQYDNDEAITQRTNKAYLGLKNDIIHPDKSGPSSVDKGTNKSINIRIPKLVAMYASRACRSAIMIGTCLKTPDMRSIVDRLQHVDQPWNCPHGRPTIRHLADISQLTDSRHPC